MENILYMYIPTLKNHKMQGLSLTLVLDTVITKIAECLV